MIHKLDFKELVKHHPICKFKNAEDTILLSYIGHLGGVKEVDGITYYKRLPDGDWFDGCDLLLANESFETNHPIENLADEHGLYLTDDRDADDSMQNVLEIYKGGNNDYYVCVKQKGHLGGKSVRISTSGGASMQCPLLVSAVGMAYRALRDNGNPNKFNFAPNCEFKRK